MVERATAAEEKRRLILDAAVRVFARSGFHTSRVGDIAEEAGVAHGLLYHYFSSKDEVLETIFREQWGVLVDRLEAIEASGEPAVDQLRHVAAIVLRNWKHQPDVIRVLVREIARSGFHTSRVGDIAEEAGVAHGLLYHYFSSKDEVLETIFREQWGVLVDRISAIEDSGEPAIDQLRHVAAIVLRNWRHQPDVIRVLVREIARSPEVQQRIGELVKPIAAVQRIIERGQASGELRADLHAQFAAVAFYGGIEELLSGWVLGQLPDDEESVAAGEETVAQVLDGFRA